MFKSKFLIFIYVLSGLSRLCLAQQLLSLEECHRLARNHYPLVRQTALLEESKHYSLENAARGTLPQAAVVGQATYQSAVTQVPIELPGASIPTLSKDQYKLYGEVSQSLTDLYTVRDQKALIGANTAIESQRIEVELYRLRERVEQLYFGLLLLEAQLVQQQLLRKDLQIGLDRTHASIANGTALRSSADLLKAELLRADQREIELRASRKGYADMLSLLLNVPVSDSTRFQAPVSLQSSSQVSRPELELYRLQKQAYLLQQRLIDNRNLPRISFFFQGGVGRPALNLLSNQFEAYYLTGLRLNWNLSGLYTSRMEKLQLGLSQQLIHTQQEVFLFNTQLSLRQQDADLNRVKALIVSDQELIRLRESIKNTSKIQLENGVVTPNDYLGYVNAEDQVRQSLLLHQIQLLQVQYARQFTSGN